MLTSIKYLLGIWDINTLTLSQMLDGHSAGVWSTMFRTCSGDSILCSGSEDSSVKIWDLRTQNKWLHVANLVGVHDDAVKCCAWSPCGNYIAAGSSDTRVFFRSVHFYVLIQMSLQSIGIFLKIHRISLATKLWPE